jgi:class 3 adenylate cyclase
VVVRAIGSALHMDYTAGGQTTHLVVCMKQMARPGSIVLTAKILRAAGRFPIIDGNDPSGLCNHNPIGFSRWPMALSTGGMLRDVPDGQVPILLTVHT